MSRGKGHRIMTGQEYHVSHKQKASVCRSRACRRRLGEKVTKERNALSKVLTTVHAAARAWQKERRAWDWMHGTAVQGKDHG
jgi:hypothetical protein